MTTGIVDVLVLCRRRHQEVHADEPRNELGIVGAETVALTKRDDIVRAERRVVAAAPFRDVVKEPAMYNNSIFGRLLTQWYATGNFS